MLKNKKFIINVFVIIKKCLFNLLLKKKNNKNNKKNKSHKIYYEISSPKGGY